MMMRQFSAVFQRVRKVFMALGWRKACIVVTILFGGIAFGAFQLHNQPEHNKGYEASSPSPSQQVEEGPAASDAPQVAAATTESEPQAPGSTQSSTSTTPKTQKNAPVTPPSSATLSFSVAEISVHAGWESNTAVASLSSGEQIAGVGKEWNDNSPVSVAMPLGSTASKSVPFFITTSTSTAPGTYTIKVRASASSQSYTANLVVRVLPPLFAFESINYDAGLEGYVIALAVHDNFAGTLDVQLSAAPNGTPCSGTQYFIDQLDETTFTFECLYGLSGVHGNYPLTFLVTDGKKSFTKSVTWAY